MMIAILMITLDNSSFLRRFFFKLVWSFPVWCNTVLKSVLQLDVRRADISYKWSGSAFPAFHLSSLLPARLPHHLLLSQSSCPPTLYLHPNAWYPLNPLILIENRSLPHLHAPYVFFTPVCGNFLPSFPFLLLLVAFSSIVLSNLCFLSHPSSLHASFTILWNSANLCSLSVYPSLLLRWHRHFLVIHATMCI